MDIIRGTGSVPYEKTVIALGNFDGLHKAHMTIIDKCCEYARRNGLKSGVLLFNEHTLNIIKNKKVKVITQERQKLDILHKAGIDFVYIRDFDKEFMQLSAEEFANMLVNTLNVSAVCVGYDYRFGYKAQGDGTALKALGEKYGFDVIVTDEIDHNGVAVKSTAVRHFIEDGSVHHAASLLGRPFEMEGKVVKGLQNGRKMGIPTANLEYDENMVIPQNGVYMGYTYVGGKKYKSVINVGNNPTFNAEKITIESHILGFNGDIYDETISIAFIKRIRGDKRFDGIDALITQINKDIETAGKELV